MLNETFSVIFKHREVIEKCYFVLKNLFILRNEKGEFSGLWSFRKEGKKEASHNNNSVKWSGENGVLHGIMAKVALEKAAASETASDIFR